MKKNYVKTALCALAFLGASLLFAQTSPCVVPGRFFCSCVALFLHHSVFRLQKKGSSVVLAVNVLSMVPTSQIVLNKQLTQNPGYNKLFGLGN